MDSQLLKSAICDAKAVRATALANAKQALQEQFAPQMEAMLSEKIKDEIAGEDEIPTDVAPSVDDTVTDDVSVSDTSISDIPADEYSDDVGVDSAPIEDEGEPISYDEPESDMDEAVLGQGNHDPVEQTEELTEETASPDYKKTTSGHKTQDPQGRKLINKQTGTKGEPTERAGSKVTVKRDVASFTNDPQGASNEFSKGPSKNEKNATGKVLENTDAEVEEGSLEEVLKELENEVAGMNENEPRDDGFSIEPTAEDAEEELGIAGQSTNRFGDNDGDEDIDLDELLDNTDVVDDVNEAKKKDDEESDDGDNDEDDKKEKGEPKWNFLKENKILKTENKKYRETVIYLRDRINEVNLLNAKLLYTNRIFKTASLNKNQKIKVIEQFDLTKSVREAKLTYVNLSESLSFGAPKKVVAAAPAPVAKKPVSSSVRAITEGLASRVVGSTKPTKPVAILSEGAEMANRFKKLAGIKSK